MTAVLVTALGLTALRNPTDAWAGAMFLVTLGVLTLAVVGAACQGGDARVWWIGFALFGWIHFGVMFLEDWPIGRLPTITLLALFMQKAGLPVPYDSTYERRWFLGVRFPPGDFARIGHCLWTLIIALAGATTAGALFGTRTRPTGAPPVTVPRQSQGRRTRYVWSIILAVAAIYSAMLYIVAGRPLTSGGLAGATYLLTLGLLGTAALGAIYARGRRRQVFLGMTLFGGGYLICAFARTVDHDYPPALPTDRLLKVFRPSGASVLTHTFPSAARTDANMGRILEALEKPIAMPFPNETPLADVLKYIERETTTPDGWQLPIYIEPLGLEVAEVTETSPVAMDLKGLPLKTTLWLLLKQLGLTYRIKDGLVHVVSAGEGYRYYEDPFLIVGHCLFALLSAGLGGLLAPIVATGARSESRADT